MRVLVYCWVHVSIIDRFRKFEWLLATFLLQYFDIFFNRFLLVLVKFCIMNEFCISSSQMNSLLCQLQKDCFHQNLSTTGGQSLKSPSLELGLLACQLQWNFWIKGMRFGPKLLYNPLRVPAYLLFWHTLLIEAQIKRTSWKKFHFCCSHIFFFWEYLPIVWFTFPYYMHDALHTGTHQFYYHDFFIKPEPLLISFWYFTLECRSEKN